MDINYQNGYAKNTFYGGQSTSIYYTYSNDKEKYENVDIYEGFRLNKSQKPKHKYEIKCCTIL